MSIEPTAHPDDVHVTHASENALAELEILAAEWAERKQRLQDASSTDLPRRHSDLV